MKMRTKKIIANTIIAIAILLAIFAIVMAVSAVWGGDSDAWWHFKLWKSATTTTATTEYSYDGRPWNYWWHRVSTTTTIQQTTLSSVPGTASTTTTVNTTTTVPTTTTSATTTTSVPQNTTTTQAPTTTTTGSGITTVSPFEVRANTTYSNLNVAAGSETLGIYWVRSSGGVTGVKLQNITVSGSPRYGVKFGGAGGDIQVDVDRLTVESADTALYLGDVVNSTFANMDLNARRVSGTNQYHTLYLEGDCDNLLFKDSTFTGGSGYTIHMYGGHSTDVTMDNCVIDARSGRIPIVVSDGHDGIIFKNCTIYGNDNVPLIVQYGATDVVFENCTFVGGSSLGENLDNEIQFINCTRNGTPINSSLQTANLNLQSAIDQAVVGGVINVPGGSYGDIRLKSNITLTGSGTVQSFSLRNLTNVSVNGINVNGGDYGVYLEGNNTNVTFSDMDITNSRYFGVFVPDSGYLQNALFDNVTVSHCGDFGFHVNGSGRNITFQDCLAYDFAGTDYQPHAYYLKNVTGLTFINCEARGPLGYHRYGESGWELDNCDVVLSDCRALNLKVQDEGYGFILLGTGTARLVNCYGSGNLYDFYECAYTGSAQYINCTGTHYIWP
jgi:Right handed beta helix region